MENECQQDGHISSNIRNFDTIFSWLNVSRSPLQLTHGMFGLIIKMLDSTARQKWYYFAYMCQYPNIEIPRT